MEIINKKIKKNLMQETNLKLLLRLKINHK